MAPPLLPDPRALQAFESAARHNSFTQAARELNLTQSAVSRQIKDLEARLGVALFERVRQRVVLSTAGARFLPEVRRLLRQTEESLLRVMASAQAEDALNIAVLPAFGSRWLMPRLPDFIRRHPGTALNVAARTAPFDFDDEPFDLAIHYGAPVWARAHCRYLCDESIVPVASRALLATRPLTRPEDLAAVPLLHLASRAQHWREWFAQQGLTPALATQGHRFELFSMLIEAAVHGLGAALIPRYLIDEELKEGYLQVLFEHPLPSASSYYLVVPDNQREHPAAAHFTQWILQQVGPPPGRPPREGGTST